MTPDPAQGGLTVEALAVGYTRPGGGTTTVVSNVSLRLEPGKILGLAGESGCGKSTTALAAVGYRIPGSVVLSGQSMLDGVDLLRLPPDKLRALWGQRIAYVAQNAATALNPRLTVGRQLAEPLTTHLGLTRTALRERQVELLEALELPGAEAALGRYPHEFSGGQQRRISIALALACKPSTLVLDEPTAGLDVTSQARVAALIGDLVHETGVATLYLSHDLGLLSGLADRLAVMYAGQIVEEGSSDDVCLAPAHPYTQGLLVAVPNISTGRTAVGMPGRPPSSVILDSCAFAARCPHQLAKCTAGSVALRSVADGHVARCVRVGEVAAPRLGARRERTPAEVESEPLLRVDELFCEYGAGGTRVTVVHGVSLAVARGETLGMVGESGSGKSTLLRAISGVHPPSAGTIMFRGTELAKSALKRPRSIRREFQLVFQNPESSLNPRQTAEAIVARPIRLFRDDVSRSQEREVIEELIDAVKLPRSVLHRYPGQLSGGQKQRVALARAFAARPSVLLCDEVTSALDVSVQATIVELVGELAATFSVAVIFVSHDLAVVRSIADRMVVVRHGQICEQGDPGQVCGNPSDAYTQELIAAIPKLPVPAVGHPSM